MLSQVLTLYTTPVIYIFFDAVGRRFSGRGKKYPSNPNMGADPQLGPGPGAEAGR